MYLSFLSCVLGTIRAALHRVRERIKWNNKHEKAMNYLKYYVTEMLPILLMVSPSFFSFISIPIFCPQT